MVPFLRLSYPTFPSDLALALAQSATDEGRPLSRAPEPALAHAAAPLRRIVDDQTLSAVVVAGEVLAVAVVVLQGATLTEVDVLALGRAPLYDEYPIVSRLEDALPVTLVAAMDEGGLGQGATPFAPAALALGLYQDPDLAPGHYRTLLIPAIAEAKAGLGAGVGAGPSAEAGEALVVTTFETAGLGQDPRKLHSTHPPHIYHPFLTVLRSYVSCSLTLRLSMYMSL